MQKLRKFTYILFSIAICIVPLRVMAADSCDSLIGSFKTPGDFAYYLGKTFELIQFLGVGFCIVLTIFDIIRFVANGDKGESKTVATTFFKRVIYAVIIFFVPLIVKALLLIFGIADTCVIG